MAWLQELSLDWFLCSFDKYFLTSSGRTRTCAWKEPLGEDKTEADSTIRTVKGRWIALPWLLEMEMQL